MKGPRYALLLVMVTLSAWLAGCGERDAPHRAADMDRGLAGGREAAAAWVANGRADPAPAPETAIAIGYLERLRLGLGSPFRLIDYALQDPRLDEPTRERLAWALLARIIDRQTYRIDPAALDRVGLAGVGRGAGVGRYHLELIEDAVTEAPDPRGGELAVRLAYTLATAEGAVGRRAPVLAAQAAALVRDRELARGDALRLLRAAATAGVDPLRLIPVWRAERRFDVERPPMDPLPQGVERDAMELAPRLAAAIQSLAPRLMGSASSRRAVRSASAPVLGPAAARVLAALADSAPSPPQAPIVVAVDVHQRDLVDRPGATAEERAAGLRFVKNARNEERFAAHYALLAAEADPAAAAGAALSAAVGMRTFAQERVWFPGFGGPTTRELEDRFGLAFVRFDDEIPGEWRPYYRRMLAESLRDLQRVLPSLDLDGLGIRFGESRTKSATLAIHDPRRRTIYLPPETGAGTIAHEIAHDLDWQVSLRRFRVRGDYGSDRATRVGGGRLAQSLQQLTTATLRPPVPGDSTPVVHGQRPAEVFARSVDWFVVVSLAREGRVDGYLSSAQDDLLTGYGTVTPPDITGDAGQALIAILDEVAPVFPAHREWFLKSYGRDRSLTPYDLVRRVVEAAEDEPTGEYEPVRLAAEAETPIGVAAAGVLARRLAAVEKARDAALDAIDAWACQTPAAAYDGSQEIARRRLVARAAAATARGIALEFADEVAGGAGRGWLMRRLYGPPWPSESLDAATEELLDALVETAEGIGRIPIAAEPAAFRIAASPRRCTATALLTGDGARITP